MSDWTFAQRGFSLFPLLPHTKLPNGRWRKYMEQHASPEELAEWQRHSWNTGVATGAISGIIVLDCDNLLARIEAERRGVPPTLTISTPRGTHFYFQHPGWHVGNKVGLMWPGWSDLGIDVRGDGGFVVGPGSHFIPSAAEIGKGKIEGRYAIEHDLPVAPLPDWLAEETFPKPATNVVPAEMAEETSAYGRNALEANLQLLSAAGDGQVSHMLYATTARIAELVAGGEITTEEGWGGLYEVMAARDLADEDKANGTVQRAWAKGTENPKRAPERMTLTAEMALGVRKRVAPPPPSDGLLAPAPPVDLSQPFVPPVKPRYVGPSNMHEYFRGCVYIGRRDEIFHPAGLLLARSPFDCIYGGPLFSVEDEGKAERSAWSVFRVNDHSEMPKAWDICFRPELAPGTIVDIAGLPYLNVYVPVVTKRREGDASRFVDHVRKMLPHGRDADLLLHWMASAVQNPGAKFQWWPVIQGTKGNGKSLLLDCMFEAIPERYTHKVRADSVMKTANQFNGWIEQKLFLGFEEIRTSDGKRDFVELMKDTVTARRLSTESKGKGQGTSDNRANGMMLTNHDDAVPIDDDERRWGIFYCAQQRHDDLARDGMSGSYFNDLYEWLRGDGFAIVTHFLATMPLHAALDPARCLQRAPETTSTREAVGKSLGLVEQEIIEAVEQGLGGFRGGVISSLALGSLFTRLRKQIAPQRYRSIMSAIGYATHPVFEASRGRPNNPLADSTRPTLYFLRNDPIMRSTDYGEVLGFAEKALLGILPGNSNVVPFKR